MDYEEFGIVRLAPSAYQRGWVLSSLGAGLRPSFGAPPLPVTAQTGASSLQGLVPGPCCFTSVCPLCTLRVQQFACLVLWFICARKVPRPLLSLPYHTIPLLCPIATVDHSSSVLPHPGVVLFSTLCEIVKPSTLQKETMGRAPMYCSTLKLG